MADIEEVTSTKQCSSATKCLSICSQEPHPDLLQISASKTDGGSAPTKHQISIFEVFKIGIGPSSSHTNGPMSAACAFISELRTLGKIDDVARVQCDLYGSLALTGAGHQTDGAVCVGLSGMQPSTVDPDEVKAIFERCMYGHILKVGDDREIPFNPDTDMIFHYDQELPQHPNALRLTAYSASSEILNFNEYYSIGGGFIQTAAEYAKINQDHISETSTNPGSPVSVNTTKDSAESLPPPVIYDVPFPFSTCAELIEVCVSNNLTVAEVVIRNETAHAKGDRQEVEDKIDRIYEVMNACIERGLVNTGRMPLSNHERQAPGIYKSLQSSLHEALVDHFAVMDWICLFARSVNEENACGGRIVTSPTNGASGTMPAVLAYYQRFLPSSPEGIRTFIATAGAIASIIKTNASISGAEAGCQAEVGSASAMAAAGLTAARGGNIFQIEHAAEIALEHHLGLTCDPVNGLVQIPCIERNSLAAVKAITSHRLAMRGDGAHHVSLDSCIETMYKTGLDMQAKYRETSLGGLAVHARTPKGVIVLPRKRTLSRSINKC